MRDVLLILPDLRRELLGSLPMTDAVPAAASTGCGWRVPAAVPRGFSWREAVARAIESQSLAECSVATVLEAARAAAVGVAPVAGCWVATPVHFLPGLTHVHAPLDTVLHLPQDEADEIAHSFRAVFGEDGALRLLPAGAAGFLLQGLVCSQVRTVEPADLRGRNLKHCQPEGDGRSPVRRLMSEIEMWLHDHPLNRRREVRGVPVISSLWLWGAEGAMETWPGTTGSRRVHCLSDDPWMEAACELLGLVSQPAPQDVTALLQPGRSAEAAQPWIVVRSGWDLECLQQAWLQPLCQALTRGQLDRLQIETADQSLMLERRDRWRFWRRAVNPLQALGHGAESGENSARSRGYTV